jgi:hypothetical protein
VTRLSDYAHDAGWYARKATVPVRNGPYRLTDPVRSARGSYRNYRNRRFLRTGKGYWLERHTRGLRSSLPVYRNRINRAIGRPRRDDAEIYGRRDLRLAHARQGGTFDPSRAWEHGRDAYRSAPAPSPAQMRDDRTAAREPLAAYGWTPRRLRAAERADAVLGPGRARRTEDALRQARHDPWAEAPQSRRTR